MDEPATLVHYYEDRDEYEVVVGGMVLVLTRAEIDNFPNSVLVRYILNKVAEQQKQRQKEGGT